METLTGRKKRKLDELEDTPENENSETSTINQQPRFYILTSHRDANSRNVLGNVFLSSFFFLAISPKPLNELSLRFLVISRCASVIT